MLLLAGIKVSSKVDLSAILVLFDSKQFMLLFISHYVILSNTMPCPLPSCFKVGTQQSLPWKLFVPTQEDLFKGGIADKD